jgi:hypothetical protein
MLKSNGSYLYGDIGSIFFQIFYFHNIVNIDDIHIHDVVVVSMCFDPNHDVLSISVFSSSSNNNESSCQY